MSDYLEIEGPLEKNGNFYYVIYSEAASFPTPVAPTESLAYAKLKEIIEEIEQNMFSLQRNPMQRSRECPSCGVGNKPGRLDCWNCGYEFEVRKPFFGTSPFRKFPRYSRNP